tara:strand:+ start:1882 stop:3285 length:1404 start_codon:yes stop_codon:yes gene_type:complete
MKEMYKDLEGGGSQLPPLGIALLAAVIRKEGYDVKILDCIALNMNGEQTIKKILDESPDYLAVTSITISIYNAQEIIQKIKERNSSMKIIVGGPHVTAAPEETMKTFPEFDVGVIGEAEDTFVELLSHLDKEKPLDKVKGLLIRKNKEIISTGTRPLIQDLDKLPLPALDLLPDLLTYYQPATDTLNRYPATLLITSRGCPGRCNYCDQSVFGQRIRGYSADYVINMIKHLQKEYGIKEIFFQDDNFVALRQRMIEICKKIVEQKIDITFSVMGRVDQITEEGLMWLKKAGCWQINYGLESGDQRILDNIDKDVTVEQNMKAIQMTDKAGISVKGLFMIGAFGETKETIKNTLNFIKKAPIDDFHMTIYTPFPGASGYKIAHKFGKFDPDWKKVSMFGADNFVPFGITRKELEEYYRKSWRVFYLRPRIIWNYTKKLADKEQRAKVIQGGISFLKFNLNPFFKGSPF